MARGFNKAILVGNLTRDPELRYTSNQTAVCSFSLAVNRLWRGKNGETQEQVDFIPIVVWGASAENCERYLKKGSAALVEGRISTRSYDDKQGQKRYVTEIVAETVQFLSTPRDGAGRSQTAGNGFGDSASLRDTYGDMYGSDDFAMDISKAIPGSDDGKEVDIPF